MTPPLTDLRPSTPPFADARCEDQEGAVARFPLDPLTSIEKPLSDGIERAITHLHLYSDWHELLDSLFDPGIPATIARIRGAELADPNASRHPRTTPSDDAAAITCLLARSAGNALTPDRRPSTSALAWSWRRPHPP